MKPVAYIVDSSSPAVTASIELSPITILFGRTGSGKSTLLKGISNLVTPTGPHRSSTPSNSGGELLVLEAVTSRDQKIAREFITHAINNLGGSLGFSPEDFDLHPPEPVPWWEQTHEETLSRLEEESWDLWLADGEKWHREACDSLIAIMAEENLSHARALLDVILVKPIIGHSSGGGWWMCDTQRFSYEIWESVRHCAQDTSSAPITRIARFILENCGDRRFVELHRHSVMTPLAGTPRIPTMPVGSLLNSQAEEDLTWTIARSLRRFHLGSGAIDDLRAVTARHLPPFVARLGKLVLEPVAEQQFVHVRLGIDTPDGYLSHEQLSSGVRAWLGLAVSLGLSQLALDDVGDTLEPVWDSWPSDDYVELVLLDEPEAHLDPLTQEETIRWIEGQASERRMFLMASHSSIFLNEVGPGAQIYGVVREHGRTSTISLDHDLLASVERHASDLGIGRAAILQSARVLLMVEGKHDLAVLKTMFQKELSSARVLVVPLGGTGNAKDVLTEGRFFSKLGARLMLLFDNVRAGRFAGNELPLSSNRNEERIAASIIDTLRRDGVAVDMLPFDRPDIICAIPETTIARAFPSVTCDWSALVREYRSSGKGNFKDFALGRMGLGRIKPSEFVERCLTEWKSEDGRDSHLEKVLGDLDTPLVRRH